MEVHYNTKASDITVGNIPGKRKSKGAFDFLNVGMMSWKFQLFGLHFEKQGL